MSWLSADDFESHILKATSSSIPNGEQDLPLNLEISDLVRSKSVPAKEVLRILKTRLYHQNPNVQILSLHLLDLLAKNGGSHFFNELTKKYFMDSYVSELLILVNQRRSTEVVDLMLDYLQTWALASKAKPEAQYLHLKYEELKRRHDIEFPVVDNEREFKDSFLESATAPVWSDSDTCMKSGQPFTFYNRKHHCRNCGGVFLQENCSEFRALPHFGINTPVRVCVDCDERLANKFTSSHTREQSKPKRQISSNNSAIGSRYTHDLQQAINMSLQNSGTNVEAAAGGSSGPERSNEYDTELERAIQESLADLKLKEPSTQVEAKPEVVLVEPKQTPAFPLDDKRCIEEFAEFVAHATPHDAVYNPRLISLSQSGSQLQGKVLRELKTYTNKLSTLEDLHGKLMAVTRLYDQLLDAELNGEVYGAPVSVSYPEVRALATEVRVGAGAPQHGTPSVAPVSGTGPEVAAEVRAGPEVGPEVGAAGPEAAAAPPTPEPTTVPQSQPVPTSQDIPSVPTEPEAVESARSPSPEPEPEPEPLIEL